MAKSKFALILIFFLAFTAFSFAQDVLAQVVPTEILFKKNDNRNFSISPNGKYFSEVIDNSDDTELMIVDIDNYKLMHRIPMGDTGIDAVYWLTNNRLLFESSGAIYVMDIDGKNSLRLVSSRGKIKNYSWRNYYRTIRYNSLIGLLPTKKDKVLIETHDYNLYATIKEVNIFTGASYFLIHGEKYKINKWITDSNGEVRLGMKFTEKGSTYFKLNKELEKLEPFSVVIDGARYNLDISANSYLNQNITFEGFGYDPDIIYLTSNIGSDKRKLIAYNIKTEKIVDVLLEDINCDVTDVHGEGIDFVIDLKEKQIAGFKYIGIVPQYKWLSTTFANLHQNISEQFPAFFNEIIDSDASSTRFLIHQWSDSKLGNIGVYDTNDNSYAVMFHFNMELNDYKLSRSKNIIVTTRDNYKLSGYLNFPPDYIEGEKLPLVVIPHGGPWARDYWGMEEFSQYFGTRGYMTLRINYRGSTGFGTAHVLAGVHSLDEVMINDIADATNFVKETYAVDKNKIFIFGHSYGGYAAYMALLKYPNLYASGVAVSAPSDIKALMKSLKKDENTFAYDFWTSALGTQKSRYLDKISPINYTEEISKPLLVFHGKRDQIVPVEQAETMVEKMKDNGKNVNLEILNSEAHSISDSNILGYLLDKCDVFFKESGGKN